MIRRQHASPVGSPSAANSCARLALSSWAVSPYHQSIRKAARQMSISVIIGEGYATRPSKRLPSLALGHSPARVKALEDVWDATDVGQQLALQPVRGAA